MARPEGAAVLRPVNVDPGTVGEALDASKDRCRLPVDGGLAMPSPPSGWPNCRRGALLALNQVVTWSLEWEGWMGDRAVETALFDEFARAAKALASGRRIEMLDVL